MTPVVDVWVMRDALIRAGLTTPAGAQDLGRDDLEGLWALMWRERRADCIAAVKAFHRGGAR